MVGKTIETPGSVQDGRLERMHFRKNKGKGTGEGDEEAVRKRLSGKGYYEYEKGSGKIYFKKQLSSEKVQEKRQRKKKQLWERGKVGGGQPPPPQTDQKKKAIVKPAWSTAPWRRRMRSPNLIQGRHNRDKKRGKKREKCFRKKTSRPAVRKSSTGIEERKGEQREDGPQLFERHGNVKRLKASGKKRGLERCLQVMLIKCLIIPGSGKGKRRGKAGSKNRKWADDDKKKEEKSAKTHKKRGFLAGEAQGERRSRGSRAGRAPLRMFGKEKKRKGKKW